MGFWPVRGRARVAGPVQLPLNFDFLLQFTLQFPNTLIPDSFAQLDQNGQRSLALSLTPLDPSLVGTVLHNAYMIIDPATLKATFVSNPVAVRLVDGSEVQADFSGDLLTGLPSHTVSFSDESTGQVLSRLWDFDDGSTSSSQNPVHTYQVAGTYDVSLTVTGSAGDTDTETKVGYVIVQ